MKFIVAQIGARRGYAVPLILEQAGMLERFYTDLCGNAGIGRWLLAGRRLPFVGRKLSRLAVRQVPTPVVTKTRTFAGPLLRHALRQSLNTNDPSARFRSNVQFGRDLGEAMLTAGLGQATHLFTMLGEGGRLLTQAKRRGLRIISEVYILLRTERLLAEEQQRFPGWEPDAPAFGAIRKEYQSEEESDALLKCTDHFICPSQAVQHDLIENWGAARSRTSVVPYGVDSQWLKLERHPIRGRVLFVGTAELRKGIHYLAMASDKLAARKRHYEFRIAGNVHPAVARQSACRHLNFIGRVPRERIHEEFQRADVFVLPSLAEGSAEVTYEALAAGVPLVTTAAAGSVARDGIEGRIVPERDPDALADAIEQIVEDRRLRDQMAAAARERARDYTWERYGERLVTALKSLN